MQNVTKAYKEFMKDPLRNRGYIRVRIGVINAKAQDNVTAPDGRNDFTWFSDPKKVFENYPVDKLYATYENDFTKVDGTMYFLPEQETKEKYNNGIVTEELSGSLYVDFGGVKGLDIKGLTIDFGDCYPTKIKIQSDSFEKIYSNEKRVFVTEDVFDNVSFFNITPLEMSNTYGRLRVYLFYCGIINVFTNKEVKNYTFKDFVSTITETIPSQDMSVTVDNQNLYYSPDNEQSTLAYMEQGQEIEAAFGYDVLGDGNIEWVNPVCAYLKSWSADDKEAKFTGVDLFDYKMNGEYYKGAYSQSGVSLYSLALKVLNDAGITDEREYFIDPYLKNVIVKNPIPVVKHSEALQIIANAGRCSLYIDREKRIHLKASFVPDMTVSVNNQTAYSHIDKLLKDTKKRAYSIYSNDFSIVDGSIYFMPDDSEKYFSDTGYISESISDESGNFTEEPVITIHLEAGFVAYGLLIRFRNVAPAAFTIKTYYQEIPVQVLEAENNNELEYITVEQFDLFDKMEIVFTKGYPNARITIDNILIGDVTDYRISRTYDMYNTPTAIRQNKIKSISVSRTSYKLSNEEISDLVSEEIVLKKGSTDYEVRFSNASYGISVEIKENPSINAQIIESGSYYAKIRFSGVTADNTVVSYSVKGYEYVLDEQIFKVDHNGSGEEKSWKNPLISSTEHARDMEEWLASYFLGDVDYQISWRGDPRSDANDLFYLQLKDREDTLIRAYQNELKYSGAWSGTLKARKAVMSWQ